MKPIFGSENPFLFQSHFGQGNVLSLHLRRSVIIEDTKNGIEKV
ncbi:hypothetical protein [Hugenholtzia roseola]|nr:hypothetical protein [Hugenholtzia roseola]